MDYSRFDIFAMLGEGLFWVLSKLHALIGNWGWAIIGLVVLLKIALFPLSNAQYKSAAKMRKFQPRLAQLKERYGDDKQKFQQAMMELYKTDVYKRQRLHGDLVAGLGHGDLAAVGQGTHDVEELARRDRGFPGFGVLRVGAGNHFDFQIRAGQRDPAIGHLQQQVGEDLSLIHI